MPLYSSRFSKHTFSWRDGLRARGKRPLIKHREFTPQDQAANARRDAHLYHRRSLVETVISALKRQYGVAVSSQVWWRQFRELVVMCAVYNVERAVQLGVALLDWLLFQLYNFSKRRISTSQTGLPLYAPDFGFQ